MCLNDTVTATDHPGLSVEEELLRRRLAFFFMNPWDKYQARREVPWKLLLQLTKVLFVTWQVCVFAQYRYAHTKYYTDNQIAFEHLFLKGWDSVREIHAYPPATGAYAIYKQETFFGYFDYIAQSFFNIEDITVNPVFRNSSFEFCIEKFADGEVFANLSWNFKFENKKRCLTVPLQDLGTMNSTEYLPAHNFSIPWDTMTWMKIAFVIQTLTYSPLGPLMGPECYNFYTEIMFDNSDFDGQIPIGLDIAPHRIQCPAHEHETLPASMIARALNYLVMTICFSSLSLCIRALFRAQRLRAAAEDFFDRKFGWILTSREKLDFLNGWYIVICVNDIIIIIGSVIKEMIESRNVYGDLWDFCSLFLGFGVLLVWIGMLRYLGYFQTYNALILTMKGALPNVGRFLICASIIYFGFAFCGWLVLGPYHFKFKTLFSTSECLFSLVNGDDMFATFSSLPGKSALIYYFSRIYLYTFISLFIYVILSLFIAIIMDTYEIIKEYYKSGFPQKRMHDFYKAAQYDPSSNVFRRQDSDIRPDRGFFRSLSNISVASMSLFRTESQNHFNGSIVINDRTPIMT